MDTVVEVVGVSLSRVGVEGFELLDVVGRAVGCVGRLEGSLVLVADGGEDGVGSGNSGRLLRLGLDTRVGTRVEKNEGVLLESDGIEVTSVDGALQVSNTVSVSEL